MVTIKTKINKYKLLSGELTRIIKGQVTPIFNEKRIEIYYAEDVDKLIEEQKKVFNKLIREIEHNEDIDLKNGSLVLIYLYEYKRLLFGDE